MAPKPATATFKHSRTTYQRRPIPGIRRHDQENLTAMTALAQTAPDSGPVVQESKT